jgi:flagellar biosynthesis/type III secretory pathway M-ring protein FliF/YscJ
VVLAVLGLAGLAWWFGTWPHIPARQGVGWLQPSVASWYWPWALLLVGIILLAIGLRWLLAHVRSSRVGTLTLKGSSSDNVLNVDAGSVVSAAASAFADTLGVRSAHGHIERDRGQLVARVVASIEDYASLSTVSERADEVSALLRTALERPDVTCRFEFKVATRWPTTSRRRNLA